MRIGIDLGTTNTVVSYIDENGEWHLFEFNEDTRSSESKYFLPSCIAVENGQVLIGQKAIDYGREYPDRFLCNTKCMMGEREKIASIGALDFTPVLVAQYILTEVRTELAAKFPREKEFNAFVTVPARFQEPARFDTKEALKNAGFTINKMCLADEPVSAAIAYSTKLNNGKKVFVADIGGGTFDLAIVQTSVIGGAVNTNSIQTLAWGGELSLGGNDFDKILIRDIADQVRLETGTDLPVDSGIIRGSKEENRAVSILHSLPYEVKKQMYSSGKAFVTVNDLLPDYTLNYELDKDRYRNLVRILSEKMSTHIEKTLTRSGFTAGDIDSVLIVGGMAHEICLNEIIQRKFGADRVFVPDDAMVLVSKGASICNSNLELHVENRAFSSIGLLKKPGDRYTVEPLIREGEIIEENKNEGSKVLYDKVVSAASEDATYVSIKIAEYRGEFDPDDPCIIFEDKVVLRTDLKKSGLVKNIKKALGMKDLPKLRLVIEFTGDKVLILKVHQSDGSVKTLDHRV